MTFIGGRLQWQIVMVTKLRESHKDKYCRIFPLSLMWNLEGKGHKGKIDTERDLPRMRKGKEEDG